MSRIRFKFRTLLGMFLLTPLMLSAQTESKIWTLDDCINYALENNLDIRKQIQTVESQKVTLNQSGLSMLPDLNLNATNYWNIGQTIDPYTNTSTFQTTSVRTNSFGVQSNLTLFNGLQKLNTLRQNQVDLLASKYNLDVLKNDISVAVAGYYLDMLFNMELLEVAREQYRITSEQVERINKMVAAGSSAKGDLLNIQAQASAEELQVVEAENRLTISSLTLQQLIDLPVTRDFRIEKPELRKVEAPDNLVIPEVIYDHALKTRPEIRSAELRVESAQRRLAIARGTIYPTLGFGISYSTGYSQSSKEVDPDNPGTLVYEPIGITQLSRDTVLSAYMMNNYRVKSFGTQWNDNDNTALGFSLRIPIFNGWQGRSSIKQAKIYKTQSEIDLETSKRTLRKTIEQAYVDAAAALKKYNSSVEKVNAQTESFKYSEQKFNVGMLTSFDFNTSKKELTKAESELLQAKYDFIFKTTILDFYMGNPIKIQ